MARKEIISGYFCQAPVRFRLELYLSFRTVKADIQILGILEPKQMVDKAPAVPTRPELFR